MRPTGPWHPYNTEAQGRVCTSSGGEGHERLERRRGEARGASSQGKPQTGKDSLIPSPAMTLLIWDSAPEPTTLAGISYCTHKTLNRKE